VRVREPYRTSVFVIVAFIVGGVAGGALVRYLTLRAQVAAFESGPEEAQRRMLTSVLRSELDLDDDQVEALGEILRRRAERDRQLRIELEPRLAPRRAEMQAQVREILRPEQLDAFDDFCRRYEARNAGWLGAGLSGAPPEVDP